MGLQRALSPGKPGSVVPGVRVHTDTMDAGEKPKRLFLWTRHRMTREGAPEGVYRQGSEALRCDSVQRRT